MTNQVEYAVQRIWHDVQDKLSDVLYDYKVDPSDKLFEDAVVLWLGCDTYEAFIEAWEEDE